MPSFKGLLFAQGIRGIESKLRRTRIDFAALITAEGHRLPHRLRHKLEGLSPKLLDMCDAQPPPAVASGQS
jgi:hypothetical protein